MARTKGPSKKKDKGKDDDPNASPWLRGVRGVKGIVPPGRRLGPATEKRTNRWSASGVVGVRPPGKQKVGESRAEIAAEKVERKRVAKEKARERALAEAKRGTAAEGAFDAGRPVAAFQPDAFRDARDPADFKTFLEPFAELARSNVVPDSAAESLAEVITQSHAPYEITVAFTLLSTFAAKSAQLRRRYTNALERGAKAFYNLARRLRSDVKAPRGLVPETLDAIFYDLPATAYQVPYAFGTAAFLRILELLKGDRAANKKLMTFATDLHERYIVGRSLGDQPLERLFPWDPPDWAT
jgi:hypothetical protein